MGAADLAGKARAEVRQLHAFFVAWFRGESRMAEDFATCEAAFAPDFRMVTPDGQVHDRASVIKTLRLARGRSSADFAIEILQPHVAWQSDSVVLLEFVERQYVSGRVDSRRSTGLFTAEPTAPRGVVWRHLHETWMQPDDGNTIQMRAGTIRREA